MTRQAALISMEPAGKSICLTFAWWLALYSRFLRMYSKSTWFMRISYRTRFPRWSVSVAGNVITFDAGDETYTGIGNGTNNTINACALYRWVSTGSDSPLIAWVEFGAKVTDNTDFVIQWNTNGIFRVDNS